MTAPPTSQVLVFNGINGATGDYLLPPLPVGKVADLAVKEPVDARHLQELKYWHERTSQQHYGPRAGIDATSLDEAGWGVIFSAKAGPGLSEALRPLLELRKSQASKSEERFYREFAGPKSGYRPGDATTPPESKADFLARQGMGPGPADPKRVPYYLLIVGSPEEIPYRFQYQLDVQYAVGRLWFARPDGEPDLEAFARYAATVVAAESGKLVLPRRAVFFGVANPDDLSTNLSANELVEPLAKSMPEELGKKYPPWEMEPVLRDDATKARLRDYFGGAKTPALLFTASHGMGFPNGHPRQLPHQGALLCREWPGPAQWPKGQEIPPDHYFSGDDVDKGLNVLGLVSFHFACYGGGTPRMDDFAHIDFGQPAAIAPHAFVANLPRQLLGHERGGALAVIGHVERSWGYSFQWGEAGRQLQCFQDALKILMQGKPAGWAMEYFNQRYADLSSELSAAVEDVKYGKKPDEFALAGMWTANNDSRSYVILGDPAVRLPVGERVDTPPRREPLVLKASPLSGPSPPTPPAFAQGAGQSPPAAAAADAAPLNIPVGDTERRYRQRQPTREAVYDVSKPPLLRRNPPERVRRRLKDLGLPPADIEAALSGQPSYALVSGAEAPARVDLFEQIIGKNDLIGAEFLESGARAARAVGRIRVRNQSGKPIGFGTGSLIAPRLLLTNNHVLNGPERAAASTVEFNVQDGPDGNPLPVETFALAPQDFFLTDPALDFALVAVGERKGGSASLDDFGWNRARPDDDPILVEEYVNIVQHPGGRPKQLALRDNEVVDLLPDFLHYKADTQPGSSGAPVFNDQWEIVGLHHSGVPKRDGKGNILARGGRPWSEDMREDQIDWVANEGVRLSRILQFVQAQALPGDAQRRLRDELFSSLAKPPQRTQSRPLTGNEKRQLIDALTTSSVISNIVRVPDADEDADEFVVPKNAARPASAALRPVGLVVDGGGGLTIPLHLTVSVSRAGAVAAGPMAAAPPAFAEAVSIDPDYEGREGYDPEFLGGGALRVPLPELSAAQRADAARVADAEDGDSPFELKYHHYSVVLNRRRRLAFFTAVNIDGRLAKSPQRERDKWFYDPRVDTAFQIGNELYKGSEVFDRGHLVRRLDPAWGRSRRLVKVANDDTFHFTNCSPQHKRFNQGKNLWAGLEDFLLERATDERKRLTVFTGPVLADDDPTFREVQIPRQFWKVAVTVRPNGKLAALGFLVSQEDLIRPVVEEAALDVAQAFQVPIRTVESLTGLDFGRLRKLEAGSVEKFGLEAAARVPLESFGDIRLPPDAPPAPGAVSYAVGGAGAGAPAAPAEGYYLLAYDKDGNERADAAGAVPSAQVLKAAAGPVTDVVVFSHGWLNDVPSARRSYQSWLETMRAQQADAARARAARPGFQPLLIGLHWPSQPWGDERLADNVSFAADAGGQVARLVDAYAQRLGDKPEVRGPLQAVLENAVGGGEPKRLPKPLADAYRDLDKALGLRSLGVAAAPGEDREGFDPEAVYQDALAEAAATVSFALLDRDTLLAPLRTLSFWTMKDRARRFGEKAGHALLTGLQEATAGRDVRFHLVGHSFGCAAASAAVAGPPGGPGLPRPVDSLVLLQGALSLWAYCASIAFARGQPGYFYRMMAGRQVRGPVVTTQSRYDKAVGTWYPRGAAVARQVVFALDEFPKYGGLGAYGARGPGLAISDGPMRPAGEAYDFAGGQVYNLEASAYVRNSLGFFAGAHSDICHPEVAHAVWSAWLA
jgi:DNA/RNA endonuclease G (NUC1)/V8-like Glu-specific endopeptidase